MIKNVIPNLHLWCSLYRDPRGVFEIFSRDGDDRMGAKRKTQKNPGPKINPPNNSMPIPEP